MWCAFSQAAAKAAGNAVGVALGAGAVSAAPLMVVLQAAPIVRHTRAAQTARVDRLVDQEAGHAALAVGAWERAHPLARTIAAWMA